MGFLSYRKSKLGMGVMLQLYIYTIRVPAEWQLWGNSDTFESCNGWVGGISWTQDVSNICDHEY